MNKIVLVLVLCLFLGCCNNACNTENSTIFQDNNIEKASIKANPDSSSNKIRVSLT
jgi:hypothetical protein